MHDFAYHAPATLPEALELLDRYGEDARVIAGGTALVTLMKQRLSQPGHLVSLANVGALLGVRLQGDGLHLGAMVTQRDVETSPQVQSAWPLLAETYRRVATVRIRNLATVGGGLAHGDPNQDPPPTLMVLDARVTLASSRGSRTIPVGELWTGYFETALQPGEVVTELIVPPPPVGNGSAFLKFLPRTEDDYATVSVAALVQRDASGTCQDVRIALGSAGPTAVKVTRAEAVLRGKQPTDALISQAADRVREEVDPITDVRGSAAYKRDMAAVFVRRALQQAVAGARR